MLWNLHIAFLYLRFVQYCRRSHRMIRGQINVVGYCTNSSEIMKVSETDKTMGKQILVASEMKRLPCGYTSLSKIRENNVIYVDKTSYVSSLIMNEARPVFLSRPRRFMSKHPDTKDTACLLPRPAFWENRSLRPNLMPFGNRWSKKRTAWSFRRTRSLLQMPLNAF